MATIFDVAQEAGVSVVTVSRLMNNPKIVSVRTAEKVQAAIESLHYQPSQIARSLMGKRTNTIGVIVPNITDPFFNRWYRYLEEFASARSINLLMCNTDDDLKKEINYVKLLHSQRVDGIIIAPYSRKPVEYLLKIHMKFILFDRIMEDINANFVTTDHYQGGVEAIEYLTALGHTKIVLLKGGGVILADTDRHKAYVDVLRAHRIPYDPRLVADCGFQEEEAYRVVYELMSGPDAPTAIFAISAGMAQGAIRAIQELNLSIPGDVSVICFDELPGQRIFRPAITHVTQPVKELAERVMEGLLAKINGTEVEGGVSMYLPPQ
ncbi:MAG TPA: LacI family DNA-binding transcriptional regulator, partial [Bacteroidota bacterium]|nr:LacI family DNA-binding transcriptional regulator [Bacteroidota bacterium]